MAVILNRYPLWKYLLLVFIIIAGFIYAAPNFFGEQPAVEISGSDHVLVDSVMVGDVKQILLANTIAYQSLELKNAKLIVCLKRLDDQLKTKHVLQARFGNNYTITVNLVSASPTWLRALGALPMKLGLDLRGGVHFLLQVDVASAMQTQMQSDLREIKATLQQGAVHYTAIDLHTPTSLLLKFSDQVAPVAARHLLATKFNDYNFKIDNRDTDHWLIVALTPAATKARHDYILSQTIQVLNNRVNALGVAESIVARQGDDRIAVELPGVQDTNQASQILGGNATLEMRLVDESVDLNQLAPLPPGSSWYNLSDSTPIALKDQIVLTGSAITNATASFDEQGQPSVNIHTTGAQVAEFHRITGENIGKRMAIILVDTQNTPVNVNGQLINHAKKIYRVISAPVINSALGNSFQVTGLGSMQTATNLAIQLRSGTAPANIYPLQELLVGPSLGQANIYYGLLSVAVGLLVIVVFMIFYYHVIGLIASIALLLNLVLVVALMSLVGFTLSLPGMAAMVLTVGMAVDANVLIFERIREELRRGASPQAAIHAGYERAFSTIIDANVTTLIVAVVLFMLATSAIKAFAITLIIGLLTSMLTAIMGTRAVVNILYGGRTNHKLSIGV